MFKKLAGDHLLQKVWSFFTFNFFLLLGLQLKALKTF